MVHWFTDGSTGFTINGNVVTFDDEKGDNNIHNAMWLEGDGVSSGKHYWKIQFPTLADSAGVGLTSKNLFKKGYACKAIVYFGNLGNCERTLSKGFGPRPKVGDEIGILAIFEGDRLKVYIDVNERNLGLAFDVPSSTFDAIFPLVSFYISGSATCTKQWAIPDDYVGGTGIEGNWKLVKLQSYGVLVDLPGDVTSKMFKRFTDNYTWRVKVFNEMKINLAKQDDGAWRKYLFAHALLTQGPFEYMNVEYLIAELMQIGINSIDVDANKNLLVESDHTFSTWTRIDPPPQPSTFVGDPFEQKHYMSNKNKHGRW